MIKDFSLSNDNAMINFTVKYCTTHEELLTSNGFRRVTLAYLKTLEKRGSNIYKYISELKVNSDNKEISENVIDFLKLLTIMDEKSIINVNDKYKTIFQDKDMLINFLEGLYGFWRKLERYTFIENVSANDGIGNLSFLDANNRFSNLVLSTYRKIEENIEGHKPKVYRQLPAGGNVGVIVNNIKWNIFDEYQCLKGISFIDSVLIDPPFIIYPKKNTRDGLFSEVYENPLRDCDISKEHWYCMPVKVGELLAFIYFHRDFMSLGISLCNLFEMARREEYENKKPDIIYVFGAKDDSKN